MEQVLFFIQNTHSREGRKLPKCYVKLAIFSSIAWINVGSFSISFGSKFPVTMEIRAVKVLIFLTKTDFFYIFNFEGL